MILRLLNNEIVWTIIVQVVLILACGAFLLGLILCLRSALCMILDIVDDIKYKTKDKHNADKYK